MLCESPCVPTKTIHAKQTIDKNEISVKLWARVCKSKKPMRAFFISQAPAVRKTRALFYSNHICALMQARHLKNSTHNKKGETQARHAS